VRILVIGLESAAPEMLFGDERLSNLRYLMKSGLHGRLESVVTPDAVPAWLGLATGRDPGTLGVYGDAAREGRDYEERVAAGSRPVIEPTIWDYVAAAGKRSILVDVPPNVPDQKVHGIAVGVLSTADETSPLYASPPEIAQEIADRLGPFADSGSSSGSTDKIVFRDDILARSRRQFEVARLLLNRHDWHYFQFVDSGLGRIQERFWPDHDPMHVLHDADSPYRDVIRDYYRYLDEQIGSVLELLGDETVVAICSERGAQHVSGGFCLNDWLIREGFLTLHHYPEQVTPFSQLDVDWDRTLAWSRGAGYARISLNVEGREPRGAVAQTDFRKVRDDLRTRLEAVVDSAGAPLKTLVFKPNEAFRELRGIAPDLIAQLGGLACRSITSVGHQSLHVGAGCRDLEGYGLATHGAMVLAGPNVPDRGEVNGAHLLDFAPTLLSLGGFAIPESLQDRTPIGGRSSDIGTDTGYSEDDDALIRDRLSGLGYI
jgi:predicted AlkP superfamily phosphohydrolase/phosphomutase